jgi:hypothetical protein
MADSLTTLKARVASELHRSDLTTQIASAITSAIAFYRSKRFEFSQKQTSFNTVADQESYTSGDTGFPTDIGQIDVVRITQSGQRIVMKPIAFSELQALSANTSLTDVPSRYAWYAQKLFLYPIPDGVYAIQISHQQRKAAPSSDDDTTTVWTNDVEALIRARAKKLICRDVTYDTEGEQKNERAEMEAFGMLMSESSQLQDDGSPMVGSW